MKKINWLHSIFLVLSFLAFLSCTPAATPQKDIPKSKSTIPDAIVHKSMAFLDLKKTKGHFEGGTFQDDLDTWMGTKHQLMIDIADHISSNDYPYSATISLLGKPDRILKKGDQMFAYLLKNPKKFDEKTLQQATIHLFFWRGMHDFLYLIVLDDAPLWLDWYHAYE